MVRRKGCNKGRSGLSFGNIGGAPTGECPVVATSHVCGSSSIGQINRIQHIAFVLSLTIYCTVARIQGHGIYWYIYSIYSSSCIAVHPFFTLLASNSIYGGSSGQLEGLCVMEGVRGRICSIQSVIDGCTFGSASDGHCLRFGVSTGNRAEGRFGHLLLQGQVQHAHGVAAAGRCSHGHFVFTRCGIGLASPFEGLSQLYSGGVALGFLVGEFVNNRNFLPTSITGEKFSTGIVTQKII